MAKCVRDMIRAGYSSSVSSRGGEKADGRAYYKRKFGNVGRRPVNSLFIEICYMVPTCPFPAGCGHTQEPQFCLWRPASRCTMPSCSLKLFE